MQRALAALNKQERNILINHTGLTALREVLDGAESAGCDEIVLVPALAIDGAVDLDEGDGRLEATVGPESGTRAVSGSATTTSSVASPPAEPAICGKMNHIQCERLRPARISEIACW